MFMDYGAYISCELRIKPSHGFWWYKHFESHEYAMSLLSNHRNHRMKMRNIWGKATTGMVAEIWVWATQWRTVERVDRYCTEVWGIAPEVHCDSNFLSNISRVTSNCFRTIYLVLMLSGLPKTRTMRRESKLSVYQKPGSGTSTNCRIIDQVIKKCIRRKKTQELKGSFHQYYRGIVNSLSNCFP